MCGEKEKDRQEKQFSKTSQQQQQQQQPRKHNRKLFGKPHFGKEKYTYGNANIGKRRRERV